MMGVPMWHPGTGGIFEAPDGAVDHYRQSGWLLLSEREEHEARMADRAAVEATESAGDAKSAAAKSPKTG